MTGAGDVPLATVCRHISKTVLRVFSRCPHPTTGRAAAVEGARRGCAGAPRVGARAGARRKHGGHDPAGGHAHVPADRVGVCMLEFARWSLHV
jgi:hypothetical protein